MANKSGGVEADLTVSVLEKGDGSSVVQPDFDGKSECTVVISKMESSNSWVVTGLLMAIRSRNAGLFFFSVFSS